MKLPNGMKVYVGGRKYAGEMPDDLAPKGLKKKLEKGIKKPESGSKANKAD